MHIAFIGVRSFPSDSAGVSGVEVRIESLISLLQQRHRVDIYTRKWLNHKVKRKQNLVVIPINSPQHKYLDTFIYSFFASVSAALSSADVIFFESSTSSIFCFIPKLLGKKIIVTIHSQEWQRKKWNSLTKKIIYLLEGFCIRIADKVITVSEELKKYLKDTYHVTSETIPYFINNSLLKKPVIISKKYNLYGNDYILYLGRFTPEKRIEWLIKAYKEMNPNLKLVLSGDSLYEKTYGFYIHKLVKNNSNIILTGNVFHEEKAELLGNCALFVLPSEIEGFPISLCEAISHNKCFLVGRLPDIQEKISDKHLFFSVKSYSNFFNKLQWLLKHSYYKQKKDKKGEFLTQAAFLKKYDEIITEIENKISR